MKRRDFLKNTLPATVTIPALLNGFSVQAYTTASPLMQALAGSATATDKVLVMIQMSGGNDGLNMVIPLDQIDNYTNARSNIAIPLSKALLLNGNLKTALHPSMTGMQALYNEGKMAIVQSVGYPSPNFSHFRATDIWMSASDSNQEISTGWAGRYLGVEYPNYPEGFPNATMTDPLAIQIGSLTSLALQGPSVTMGMSISDPASFYNFLNGVQDPVPNTPWGKELSYLRQMTQQTQLYAAVIKDASAKVTTQSTYPSSNDLAAQLKIVARLIAGGLKTRVYMVSTGGFDTHSNQVSTGDTSIGTHANLMARVSDAVRAFMLDIKGLGVEDRVIGMTFSEFGRRIKSNSSLGTDHGAAAPVFVFGKNVRSGIIGNSPTIATNVSVNDNIPYQYDFRSIYASILKQWFCVNSTDLQLVMLKNFQELPLCVNGACGITGLQEVIRGAGEEYVVSYPNPFVKDTRVTFRTLGGHTMVQILDTMGRVVRVLTDRDYVAGTYHLTFDSEGLPLGVYYVRFQNKSIQQVKSILKVR